MATVRKRRRWVWLVAAAVLLVLGAWLMRSAEPPERPPPPEVSLPRRMTHEDRERNEKRQTWLAPAVAFDGGLAPAPQRPKDPVLAMMPPEVKRGAMVAEVNAILNSELGPLMVACVFGDEGEGSLLTELRDAGLDPRTKLDRVAMMDDALVVTGDFRGARFRDFLPASGMTTKQYGKRGEIYEITRPDGGLEVLGSWDDQMLIAADDVASMKTLLDRLDGTGPQRPGVIDDSMAYGEVYGVIAGDAIADAVGSEDAKLGETIRQATRTVNLHADMSHDVGLVADVQPSDAAKTEELRRSLGSALALARMQAQARGKKDEAELFDLAHVRGAEEGGTFRLEAGLPYAYLEKSLKACVEKRKERRARRAAGLDAGPGDDE